MILINDSDSKYKGMRNRECIIAANDYDDIRIDFQALFGGILQDTEVTMIFLEELSDIQPKLEERIKDVQNSSSNSDRK